MVFSLISSSQPCRETMEGVSKIKLAKWDHLVNLQTSLSDQDRQVSTLSLLFPYSYILSFCLTFFRLGWWSWHMPINIARDGRIGLATHSLKHLHSTAPSQQELLISTEVSDPICREPNLFQCEMYFLVTYDNDNDNDEDTGEDMWPTMSHCQADHPSIIFQKGNPTNQIPQM